VLCACVVVVVLNLSFALQRSSGGPSTEGQGGPQAPRRTPGTKEGRDPQDIRQGGRSRRQEVIHAASHVTCLSKINETKERLCLPWFIVCM